MYVSYRIVPCDPMGRVRQVLCRLRSVGDSTFVCDFVFRNIPVDTEWGAWVYDYAVLDSPSPTVARDIFLNETRIRIDDVVNGRENGREIGRFKIDARGRVY
jgi:hypothetical protein